MKKQMLLLLSLVVLGCKSTMSDQTTAKSELNTALDVWHKAAAKADASTYFGMMTDDAIYIGTDATENWDKKAFEAFVKPYFDKGKAWSFTPLERHIFVSKDGKTAWFDELLNTQMKICRGSGVLVKEGKAWNALIDGISGGFAVLLTVRNIVVP